MLQLSRLPDFTPKESTQLFVGAFTTLPGRVLPIPVEGAVADVADVETNGKASYTCHRLWWGVSERRRSDVEAIDAKKPRDLQGIHLKQH